MTREELICALERTASDNHRCFACGYEHNCGIHGCAINRAAATAIKEQSAQLAAKDAEIEQMRQTFNDAVVGLTTSHDNVYARLTRVTAERDAAVELLGKLDRCMMLLDAAKDSLMPNPAVQQTIRFAMKAIGDWRTPAKQDEEG